MWNCDEGNTTTIPPGGAMVVCNPQIDPDPFGGYSGQTCSTRTGLEWTTHTFDTAGRPWKITTPDGAVSETIYGLATTGAQIGTTVTVKDQALKERRSITNAFGQLTRVDEPNTSGQLGSISAPIQPSYCAYDILNNLTTVSQGVQTRSFVSTSTEEAGGIGGLSNRV
ncbi:MAG: hypothetical protein WBD22_04100 [Pyrinomonadaceae bacterium]